MRWLFFVLLPLVSWADLPLNCDNFVPPYQEGYHENMELLLRVATNNQRGFSKYDEGLVQDLCDKSSDSDSSIQYLVDYGYIKKSQAIAIKEILGLEERSIQGIRYEQAYTFLVDDVGLCLACASSPAERYSLLPESKCARVIDLAMSGDKKALNELKSEPKYCQRDY